MSTALHLAKADDIAKLIKLVTAYQQEMGLESLSDDIEHRLAPLLEGSPYGAVYLMGPTRAPIGFATLTFSWSLEFGGMSATLNALYVRPAVRRRGIASEVLISLRKMLREAQVTGLHIQVEDHNTAARRLFERARFEQQDGISVMHQPL